MEVPFTNLRAQYKNLRDDILKAVDRICSNAFYIQGPDVTEFEESFSSKLNSMHCIAVGNGTDALQIALMALGVGPGDEVIVPAMSFTATAEAVALVGADIVFVDIEPEFYTLDPSQIKKKISPKTKCIIPVHLYGCPAKMEEIIDYVKNKNISVVEDASQAHLARYKSKFAATIGDIGCFSFYPGKNLGAFGDAGAIVTDSVDLANKCRKIANHGRLSKYDHEFVGMNSRMDSIQGAILNIKLAYLAKWTEKRQQLAKRYSGLLSKVSQIKLPRLPSHGTHVFHLYTIISKERDNLIKFLRENGVTTGIHYPIPLPNLKAYDFLGHTASDFPIASAIANEVLSLPIFPEMTNEMVDYVADNIIDYYRQH